MFASREPELGRVCSSESQSLAEFFSVVGVLVESQSLADIFCRIESQSLAEL